MYIQPKLLRISILIFISLSFSHNSKAQEVTEKESQISYFAGSGMGGHDMLPARQHYIGVDQSVWKFLYASAILSYSPASNTRYFELDDIYENEHSYNLIFQVDASLRLNLGPITITPHAGITSRYSDEQRFLSGSNQPVHTPVEDWISYREVSYKGLSHGWAVGMNLEFMIFEHTSFGVRTDFQEFNNNPTSLNTLAFQFRTNFPKLIEELKKPINYD